MFTFYVLRFTFRVPAVKPSVFLAPLLWLSTLAVASADEVHLKSGARLVGRIVENTPQHVVVDVAGTGEVTVRQGDVRKIVKKAVLAPEPSSASKAPEPPPPAPASATPVPADPQPRPPEEPKEKPPAPPPAPKGTLLEVILQKLDAVAVALEDSSKKLEVVATEVGNLEQKIVAAAEEEKPKLTEERLKLLEEQQRLLTEQQKPTEEQQRLGENLVKLGSSSVPEMIELLDKVRPAVARSLVNALVRLHPEDGVTALLPKTKSEKASVRAAAATLLGIFGKRFEGEVVRRNVEHVESNITIEEDNEGKQEAKKEDDKKAGEKKGDKKNEKGEDKKPEDAKPEEATTDAAADAPASDPPAGVGGSGLFGDAAPESATAAGGPGLLSGDKKDGAAASAAAGKEVIDDRAVAALRELVRDTDASVRAAAVAGLAGLRDAESLDVIVDALVDADNEVRTQALAALAVLVAGVPPDAAKNVPLRVVDVLEREGAVDRKKIALRALSSLAGKAPMEDDRIFRALVALISHEDESLRAQTLMTLGAVAPGKAVPLLVARLPAEADAWSRIQILNALILANDTQAVPAVIDVLERDPVDRVRDAAIRTLHAITPVHFGGDVLAWRNWWKELSGKKEEQ